MTDTKTASSAWTQADDLILMKYWDERMPARVMSLYLGKSPSAIYKRATQLGLVRRR